MLEHTNSYTVINVKKNNRYSKSITCKDGGRKRAFEVIKIGLNRMKGIAWEEF